MACQANPANSILVFMGIQGRKKLRLGCRLDELLLPGILILQAHWLSICMLEEQHSQLSQ